MNTTLPPEGQPGYVRIGTDKLALPVVRVNYGMTVDELAAAIG